MKLRADAQTVRRRDHASPPSSGLTAAAPVRWLLCVICFLSGALTLVLEIAGNRLLSPLFGNSLSTWTALIGVVLVAISIGDYVGGALVDRAPRMPLLGYLMLAASAWTLIVPVLHGWLRDSTAHAGLISGPLLFSIVLFAIPACLLAAVGPFVVRLLSRTREDHQIGLSAGLVGMLTTLGSFTGTLLTGFVLIPQLGVRTIFLVTGIVAGVLGLVVLLWCRTERTRSLAMAAGVLAMTTATNILGTPGPPPGVVYEKDTFYHDLRVEESKTELGEPIRSLRLDTTLEGGQYVETGGIYITCNLYWRLAEVYCPRLERGLFLGGGGFAMPGDFARRHPNARSEVCEIDPAVIETGRRYFRLNDYPTVTPIADDARRFLANCQVKYDFIFGDAYQGVRHIPPHLITREFFALVKSRLTDDGIFFMNIISPARGEHAKLFRSILQTLRTEFPFTQAYSVNPALADQPQNVIVMGAAKEPRVQERPAASEEVTKVLLTTRLPDELDATSGAIVLTDDYNPAEWLIAEQLMFHPPSVQ
ncbi:MAG: fused MFS/spermidine synthase [Planctomycetia bacterium]|nr:fused MFS/spermidine synthase [Planctomycetia bacterium]